MQHGIACLVRNWHGCQFNSLLKYTNGAILREKQMRLTSASALAVLLGVIAANAQAVTDVVYPMASAASRS